MRDAVDLRLQEVFRGTIDGLPTQVFSQPPADLLGGNETTIYAFEFDVPADHLFSGPLVIRIFDKAATHPQQYLWEAAAHNVLASQGFPVPRILRSSVDDGLGGPWLIMDRLPGEMLGSEAMVMPWGVFRFPSVMRSLPDSLAELHTRLHALDPGRMKTELADLPIDAEMFTPEGRLQRACMRIPESWSGARRAADNLLAGMPQTAHEVICHGDLHPLNVMVDAGSITGVLDWGRICFADPEYDLAAAFLLLGASRLNLPRWVIPLVTALKTNMADRFLAQAGRHCRIDREKFHYYCAQRALEELILRGEDLAPEMGRVGGWNFEMLSLIVHEQTGQTVSLPG
jgi:aminoglycoside phosphotransferase